MTLIRLRNSILLLLLLITGLSSRAQNCVSVTCPPNIVAFSDSVNCGTVVTYAAPNDTNTCGAPLVSTTINYTGAIVTFTVPPGVTSLHIDASGAQGGSVTISCPATGGLGARMQGDFTVTPGEVLSILVGQQGFSNGEDGGGGGGTFVVRTGNVCLIAAGGGGGATNNIQQCGGGVRTGIDASITTSGTASGDGLVAGGTAGNGGGASGGSGGGGGGFLTNGVPGSGTPNSNGLAYVNGGAGGFGHSNDFGGYGGGGAGWFWGGNGGGGGGYSGGGTSSSQPFTAGGGGGSYNAGTNQVNTAGFQTGNGRVILTYGGTGPVTTTMIAGLASGASFPVGTTVLSFASTDGAGSNDSCSFSVIVQDTTEPTITCPGNVSVSNDPGSCAAVATYSPAAATDACAGVTLTMIAGGASGASFPVGVNTVVYEASDASGNTETCAFTVTVVADDSSSQALSICDGQAVQVGGNSHSASGTYIDVLQNSGGCDSVVTTVLTVAAPIGAGVVANGATLTATGANGVYQWIDCLNFTAIPGATNQVFTPSQTGTYAVVVTVGNCTDTSACSFVVGMQAPLGAQIAVFPNPTSGRLQLDLGGLIADVNIKVFDMAGKLMLVQHETKAKTAQLDLSRFENGVYFLRLETEEGQQMLRIVKQD